MEQLDTFLRKFNDVILNPIITLLFAVAVVYFLWGVSQYILNSDSDIKREEGAKQMMWGIIGIFIMIAVFGIMRVVLNTFGLDTSVIPR